MSLRVAIIGLGHFGRNLALRLTEEGCEVLAIDRNPEQVEFLQDRVAVAVTLDSTEARPLRKLGLRDVDVVVVAIGEDFQSSLLTTASLQEIGVKQIISRVISPVHERLLRLMGVQELVLPEAEAAEALANRLLLGRVRKAFELSPEYSIVEIEAPRHFIGKQLRDLGLRERYGVNLVTIKRVQQRAGLLSLGQHERVRVIGVPTPETIIEPGDILVVFGREQELHRLLEEE
ncbi:MAG: TrkA family potassium uptake protein [Candidatus Kapabacteria bacterium]|nr:TrkA family potassium uptake protein [Candidatus Kapabacteria bacterium]MDW8012932.1 TrkA family potassium uptake protein [Bacteroidota bacterium]